MWCHACERVTVAGVHCGECGKRHQDARPDVAPKQCKTPGCETYVSTVFCPTCGKEQRGEIDRRLAAGEDRQAIIEDISRRSAEGVKASMAKIDEFLKRHAALAADP